MREVDWEQIMTALEQGAVLLGKAILVFAIGRFLARLILRIMVKLLERAETDEMLIRFARSIVNAALMLIVVIAALNQLGVDTTSLIAVLASAGLAVGLALQDSMKNFASGVLLLTFKPFTRGDYVEAGGTEGTVRAISLFSTTMLTLDNKEVVIPNASIWNSVITNHTAQELRRVDMVFGIGYGDDLRKAKRIIEDVLAADERILADPAPDVAVSELADSSVNFVVRPWVKAGERWAVKFAVTEAIKLAFDEQGVSIPFPQVDVHLPRDPGPEVGGLASGPEEIAAPS